MDLAGRAAPLAGIGAGMGATREGAASEGAARATLIGIPLAFLIVAYLLPIAGLLAFGSGGATYLDVVSDGFYWRILAGTFLFATKVTLLSLVIGYPVAAFARTGSPAVARWVIFCSTVPLWTSLLARTYAWLMILNRHGLANDLLKIGRAHV